MRNLGRFGSHSLLPALLLAAACGRGSSQQQAPGSQDARSETGAATTAGDSPAEPSAPAYQAVEVLDGGAVSGTVQLAGEPPRLPDLPVTKDQDTCGHQTKNPSLELGSGKAIANAVVSLADISKGRKLEPPAQPVKLDQKGCVYIPHLQAVPVGSTIDIYNSDPILHNVHGYLGGTETVFNLAMPIQNYKIQRKLDRPGIISLKCDAGHTWMSGYIVVYSHPYYALTDARGSFTMKDIPPGRHRLKVWHEVLGERETEFTVEPGKTATVNFELAAPASTGSK